jgi:hypothetical protein
MVCCVDDCGGVTDGLAVVAAGFAVVLIKNTLVDELAEALAGCYYADPWDNKKAAQWWSDRNFLH